MIQAHVLDSWTRLDARATWQYSVAVIVAGFAALYKSHHGNASSDSVKKVIVDQSTSNSIIDNISGTPNKVLYQYFQ